MGEETGPDRGRTCVNVELKLRIACSRSAWSIERPENIPRWSGRIWPELSLRSHGVRRLFPPDPGVGGSNLQMLSKGPGVIKFASDTCVFKKHHDALATQFLRPARVDRSCARAMFGLD